MFTAICFILFLMVFFKLLTVAFKVGWGIFKIAMFLVFFPIIVPIMIFCGLAALALPIILIAGIVGFATSVA
ncbi:MAG: hypothetical protein J5910_00260 [Lachnospiraceae bacterium]|nr:hypothetical protein [Lachnospiraceae bacterium]